MYGDDPTAFRGQSEQQQRRPPEGTQQSEQWRQSETGQGQQGQPYGETPPPMQQQPRSQQGMQEPMRGQQEMGQPGMGQQAGTRGTSQQGGMQGQRRMQEQPEMRGQRGQQGSRQGMGQQGSRQGMGQQGGMQGQQRAMEGQRGMQGGMHGQGGMQQPQTMGQQGTQHQQRMQTGGSQAGMGSQQRGGYPTTQGFEMQSVTLEEVSRSEVVTVEPDDTITNVTVEMADKDVGSVVVVEDDEPIGVLTDRKIAISLGEMPDIADRTAGDLVSGNLVTGSPGMTIYDAVRKMREEGIRRLPILDGDGKLDGIVTLDDLIVLIAGELGAAAEVIEQQSPPR